MEKNGVNQAIANKEMLVHIVIHVRNNNFILRYTNPQSVTMYNKLDIVHAESSVLLHMLTVSVPS